jgi:hypothetical protein
MHTHLTFVLFYSVNWKDKSALALIIITFKDR